MKIATLTFLVSSASLGVSTGEFVLTSELVQKTLVSFELGDLSADGKPKSTKYQFDVFSDSNDQVLVANVEGTCYAAFSGTDITNLSDVLQNVSFFSKRISGDKGTCRAESGFVRAYNSNFRRKFESTLRNCAKQCGASKCPVVLTGISQGGSIATVAAVILADLDPVLITFGQLAAIRGSCSHLDKSITYLRYDNACFVNGRKYYDIVPWLPNFATHRGQQLVLGTAGISDVGKNTRKNLFPVSPFCHANKEYSASVQKLIAGPVKRFSG